jgi:AraC-like DNA-binding protein
MISAILYIGIAQCLFAALIVLSKRRKYSPDKILIAWLLSIAFKFFLLLMNDVHKEFFNIQFSAGFVPLTFGPFLYLYTRYLTDEDERFTPTQLLHFLPFVAMTLSFFLFFSEKLDFEESAFLNHDPLLWARIMYAAVYFTSIVIYTVITFVRLRDFRKNIRNKFSFETDKNHLFWLNYLALLFTATFFFYFIIGAINAISFREVIASNLFSSIGLTILAFSVSYFGLRQTNLFRNLPPEKILIDPKIPEEEALVPLSIVKEEEQKPLLHVVSDEKEAVIETAEEKYKKSGLKEEHIQPQLERLIKYMVEEKPYLNPELTIQDLSNQINISKHHLTQIINISLNKNFFNFINEYRVEEVKRKIADVKFAHLTLLAIAFESGFNSKSSFNNIFKQATGLTPSDYKKQHGKVES